MIRQRPPASEGGDRAGVVSSKTPAESVNGCANTLPVVFPVSGVRAANVAQLFFFVKSWAAGPQAPAAHHFALNGMEKQGCKPMQTYPTGYAESHRMAEKIFRDIFAPARYGGARGTNRALP